MSELNFVGPTAAFSSCANVGRRTTATQIAHPAIAAVHQCLLIVILLRVNVEFGQT
jgi:hypothetical protein